MALAMKDRCEGCEAGLANGGEAYICSYECTFCRNCSDRLRFRSPNCGGELVARPRRSKEPVPV